MQGVQGVCIVNYSPPPLLPPSLYVPKPRNYSLVKNVSQNKFLVNIEYCLLPGHLNDVSPTSLTHTTEGNNRQQRHVKENDRIRIKLLMISDESTVLEFLKYDLSEVPQHFVVRVFVIDTVIKMKQVIAYYPLF